MDLRFDTVIALAGVLVASISLILAVSWIGLRRRPLSLGAVPVPAGTAPPSFEITRTDVLRFRLDPPGTSSCEIGVITGDIKRVKQADIWVNGENTDMEMARITENSVSAIVRYWGAERDSAGKITADLIAKALKDAVGPTRPVTAGSAFVTTAGALSASNSVRYLIHVAAVHGEPGAGFRQVQNIGQCVANALTEADRLSAEEPTSLSILFPLLGTGMGGGAVQPTVQAMLGAAVNYLDVTPQTKLRAIYFLAYTNYELDAILREMESTPRLTRAEQTH